MITKKRMEELYALWEEGERTENFGFMATLPEEERQQIDQWRFMALHFPGSMDEPEENLVKIKVTDKLMAKIDRFAAQEARRCLYRWERFVSEVERTDFSHTDPKSYYAVRDLINEIARKHDIDWDKLDSDHVIWHREDLFRIDKKYAANYSFGIEVDYYDLKSSEHATKLPQMVAEAFRVITYEETAYNIKRHILMNIEAGTLLEVR